MRPGSQKEKTINRFDKKKTHNNKPVIEGAKIKTGNSKRKDTEVDLKPMKNAQPH